jgi:hypothetical protein
MADAVLDIIRQVADELSLARPVIVAASTDPQVRQLFALLNSGARFLLRKHDWTVLQSLGTITTSVGAADYSLADFAIGDFERLIPDTVWDRATLRPVRGPLDAVADLAIREGSAAPAAMSRYYRFLGLKHFLGLNPGIRITPTPDAVETIAFGYISKFYARQDGILGLPAFVADTDTSVFDFDLLVKETKWRFLAGKGHNAAGAKDEADELRDLLIGADTGGGVLDLASPLPGTAAITDPAFPEGNWDV